ncbi:hypothetical protein R6U77_03310 [Lysinibacillus louembei]|uniref:GNAT family N-acetyltransferase n=1 Tax=Lysinibacillus louembei TaxID=1470088 RepID=A0ABZ0RWY4_9BACI|nr:hypothetical protein [Lysinibacillus louembei]WPK12744.1 hypothetical protein R6U77_03310 [Lysinibacillus louembei]
MFTIQTWVSDQWHSDPIPIKEIDQHYCLFDDPKNHDFIWDVLVERQAILFGFVQINYNGQELIGQEMFSQILITWHYYKEILKQMHKQNFASTTQPEGGDEPVFTVHPHNTDSYQIILELFPERGISHKDYKIFILPRKEFLKALYDALIAYHQTDFFFCATEEHKLAKKEHIDSLLAEKLY